MISARKIASSYIVVSLVTLGALSFGCTDNGYTCEGACVPIRFEVQVPDSLGQDPDGYLFSSLNGWKPIPLENDGHAFDRDFKIFGQTFRLVSARNHTNHWIDIEIPEGQAIQYRYAIRNGFYSSFIDAGATRELISDERIVQRDEVYAWKNKAIGTRIFSMEDLDSFSHQYHLLEDRLRKYPHTPETIPEMDALVELARQWWIQDGVITYPGYDKLLSSSYRSIYYGAGGGGDFDQDGTLYCHMVEAYELPALKKELPHIMTEPTKRKWRLAGSLFQVLNAMKCESFDPTTVTTLETLYEDTIPEILELYVGLEDTTLTASIDRVRQVHAAYEPEYTFHRLLRSQQLSEAGDLLLQLVSAPLAPMHSLGYAAERTTYMTKRLVEHLVHEGAQAEALEILNLIAQKTSGLQVPTSTLMALYSLAAGDQASSYLQLAALSSRDSWEGVGEPIEFSGTYLNLTDSTQYDLQSLKGKTIIFDFWATWCPPCIAEMPALKTFQDQVKSRGDIVFVTVSMDDLHEGFKTPIDQIESFVRGRDLNFPVLLDDSERPLWKHFEVRSIPSKYMVDTEGRLVGQLVSLDAVFEKD